MNPAVTFAFVLLRVRSINSGLMYILAQCAGAVFGSLLLWGCTASLTARCTESSEESLKAVCLASELPDGEGYGPPFRQPSWKVRVERFGLPDRVDWYLPAGIRRPSDCRTFQIERK